MIISTQRKFIFYHLHKCGGTSVERSYADVSLWSDLIIGSTAFGETTQLYTGPKFGIYKHSMPEQVLKLDLPLPYAEFETVALIRDPFQICESLYRWAKREFAQKARQTRFFRHKILKGKIHHPYATWPAFQALARHDDFAGFMDYMIEHCPIRFRAFSDSLQLKHSPPGVKHVFRLEEMEDVWPRLEEIFSCKLKRMHVNTTKPEPLEWKCPHVAFIKRMYEEDMRTFGYHDVPGSCVS